MRIEGAARQADGDLGMTGRLVKLAFSPLSAPPSFRERLLQRLVAEAPVGTPVRAAGAAPATRSPADRVD